MTETSTYALHVDPVGPVDVTLTERGAGRPYLLLHGGGGPLTVAGFADLLAETEGVRVITPVHPGFNGTPRPETLTTIGGLAATYVALLAELGLDDVIVVGNSIGGWIAAEMALLDTARVSGFVLVDAVGIEVAGHPVVDFFSLTMAQVADVSYHDPDKFRIDVSALPPAAQAAMAGNRATLATYGGTGMTDATLAGRLAAVTAPTLVVWGEADRIADPVFGQALADAIPGATFTLMPETGHLPQIESPERLVRVVSGLCPGPPRQLSCPGRSGRSAAEQPVRQVDPEVGADQDQSRHRAADHERHHRLAAVLGPVDVPRGAATGRTRPGSAPPPRRSPRRRCAGRTGR